LVKKDLSGRKKVIVDIRCGYGSLTKDFIKQAKVYGLDINDEHLKIAMENKLIPLKCNIMDTLPFKNGFADFSICFSRTNEVLPAYLIRRHIPLAAKMLGKTVDLSNILFNRVFVKFGFQIILLAQKI